MTDDLIAFLRARLDDDERGVYEWIRPRDDGLLTTSLRAVHEWTEHAGAARVLRQVEAHRARLDFLIGLEHDMGPEDFPTYDSCRLLVEPGGLGDLEVGYCSCGLDSLRSRLYKIEAMPYSDHPDFRQDWA